MLEFLPSDAGESQSDSVGGVESECGDGVGSHHCQISWLIAVDSRHLLPVFRSQKATFPNTHNVFDFGLRFPAPL